MRVPITMCHGICGGSRPLDAEHYRRYFAIAREMGFESISYDRLAEWRFEEGDLPERPILFDFDHAVASIHHEIFPIMSEAGYAGNLFIHTQPMVEMYSGDLPPADQREMMTWEEIRSLLAAGWHVGAHTHTHPDLSALSVADPTGKALQQELETCDAILHRELGVRPQDFAFTGTSFSAQAEALVKRRYRFGRLWIIGAMYQADGKDIRYADLAGVPGPDETDGGPPTEARYITEQTPPHRLPSMELSALIWEYESFARYLEGATRRG